MSSVTTKWVQHKSLFRLVAPELDLHLKPSTVEQARVEYSPLVKFFNRGLKEEDFWKG